MMNNIDYHVDNRIDLLIDSIKRNEHFINDSTPKAYNFNSRMVICNNLDFLQAIRSDIGGEIIHNKTIGTYLYFG